MRFKSSLPHAFEGRIRLFVLLALSLLSLSCITFEIITHVARNDDGSHRVRLALDLLMDSSVADAVRNLEGFSGSLWGELPSSAENQGWYIQEEGERLRLSREFGSLEEFGGAAGLITTIMGTGESQIVTDLNVTADTSDPTLVKYTFSATINIPEAEVDVGPNSGDACAVELGFIQGEPITTELEPDQCAVVRAAQDAGPLGVFVVVTLPGTIQSATGGYIDLPSTVSFPLGGEPGTYVLQAVSLLDLTQPQTEPEPTEEEEEDEEEKDGEEKASVPVAYCTFVRVRNVSDSTLYVRIRTPDDFVHTRVLGPGEVKEVCSSNGGVYRVSVLYPRFGEMMLGWKQEIREKLFKERATLTREDVNRLELQLHGIKQTLDQLEYEQGFCSGSVPDFETALVGVSNSDRWQCP